MRHGFFNVRTKFELVLDIAWRKKGLGGIGQAADIGSPINNFEMAVLVQVAGIARMYPAIVAGSRPWPRDFYNIP